MKTFGTRFLCKALLIGGLASIPTVSLAQFSIGISINIGPPALPIYVQPPCPQPNYIWAPGYWAWNGIGDYYWVPGTRGSSLRDLDISGHRVIEGGEPAVLMSSTPVIGGHRSASTAA